MFYADEIKLSCYHCYSIYIVDIHGYLKQTHGPSIPITKTSSSESAGEHITEVCYLARPMICQEDDDGAVLVADRWNDHILVLTSEGQWRRVRLAYDMLLRPRDAVFWGERLYVCTWDDDNLKMFE